MRTIVKHEAPKELVQWRAPRMADTRGAGMECNYAELRRDREVVRVIEDGLFHEQGGLCAYTGRRIQRQDTGDRRDVGFHIEHLTPQAHCDYGEDADYANMVACWPAPNRGFEPAYGARRKGDWPAPEQGGSFVSPLQPGLGDRFEFDGRGQIRARDGDAAARETIIRLALNDDELVDLRKNAIRGALNPGSRPIRLDQARQFLRQQDDHSARVDRGEDLLLAEFCFALRPAVEREIRKLEGIQRSRKGK